MKSKLALVVLLLLAVFGAIAAFRIALWGLKVALLGVAVLLVLGVVMRLIKR